MDHQGQSRCTQELGLGVCVHKDQYGFILHHRVMLQQTDDKLAVVMVQETKDNSKSVGSSFDEFVRPREQKPFRAEILDYVVLPKKG